MASVLVTARATAESLIAALSPEDSPGTPFKLAPAHEPLESQPLSASPRDNTRLFQVRCVPRFTAAETNAINGLGRGGIVVVLRYHVPSRGDTGGFIKLHDIVSSDTALIVNGLRVPTAPWSAGVTNITPSADPVLAQKPDTADVWHVTHEFEILFCL